LNDKLLIAFKPLLLTLKAGRSRIFLLVSMTDFNSDSECRGGVGGVVLEGDVDPLRIFASFLV
jgi:hypothetical protein